MSGVPPELPHVRLGEVTPETIDSLIRVSRAVGPRVALVGASTGAGLVILAAGIVGRRKQGNHVYYSISDDSALGLCEQVCGGLSQRLAGLADLLEGSIR